MTKLKKWKWYDPIYTIDFTLLKGPAKLASKYISKLAGDHIEVESAGKMVMTQYDVIIWLPEKWKPTLVRDLGTLAHECFHGTSCLLLSRGVKLSIDSDEAFAYYMGWLFETCLSKLSKR